MTTTPLSERALDQVVNGYMKADEEWLVQHSETSYSYWLTALETRIESETNSDRSVKLRAQTIITRNVVDSAIAETVCSVLNRFSLSWAFAYDYEDKCIKALTAVNIYVHEVDEPYLGVVEPGPFQDAWLTLFTHSIWAQATLAEELADVVAQLTGGELALSRPASKSAPREVPDAFCYLPDVLHQRPEWLRDYKPFTHWPTFESCGEVIKRAITEEMDLGFSAKSTDSQESTVLDVLYEGKQIAQWLLTRVIDNRYGVSLMSRIQFSRLPEYTDAEMANRANLLMFTHRDYTQFGFWMVDETGMYYTSAYPSAYLRTLEDSGATQALLNYNPVFFGRLAMRTRSAFGCVDNLVGQLGPLSSRIESNANTEEVFEAIVGTLNDHGQDAFENPSNDPDDATPEPTILRNPSEFQFYMIGVFNPMGPTIMCLEAFATDTQNEYNLVETQRHPLYPSYLTIARIQALSPELNRFLEESVARQLRWLPTYLDLSGCPQEVLPVIKNIIKKRLLDIAIERRLDIPAHIKRLEEVSDSAWNRVDHELPPIEEATSPATPEQIEDYFALITSADNLQLFWREIPDAWDGSINFSLSKGILGQTDIGPLVWTYNRQIGSL